MLGRQHKKEGCRATRQADEKGTDHYPLHSTLNGQRSIFSGRLLSLSCSSDRLRKSFVPRAIQLYNATQKGRGREMDFSA